MRDETSPAISLLEIAKGMEKLAQAIEAAPKNEIPTSAILPDYGQLGAAASAGTDPLTGFLLR